VARLKAQPDTTTMMIAEPLVTEPTATPETPASSIEDRTDDRFAQRHPLQIALCLRSLASRRDFLTVEFDGRQIVTQVLDVDSRRGCFVFDLGGASAHNRALLEARWLAFRSQPNGIRTEFVIDAATLTSFEGRPAFEASFPAMLYYVQRREFHRVQTPLMEPFVASGVDHRGEAFDIRLQDMSLGGIALCTPDERFAGIARGAVWRDVSITLGALGEIAVALEIVAPRLAHTPTGERRTVLGCRFIELHASAERMLQRAITQLETRNLRRAARE
jgi:flagellar brake protein